ncbi:uncharacterized protein TOL2_C10080 [Desulfobacula toluolica Tol2]|uniref:Uncharacterized protein n=1 Tax=Desulfobacula toluolica (strain DSM 7467 / Tol2) TaxID=651182 RepID=K0NH35_DESTT|nr:uncharacterized protein TOL2_C10080 [Desulfobacula toluolica Tol2]
MNSGHQRPAAKGADLIYGTQVIHKQGAFSPGRIIFFFRNFFAFHAQSGKTVCGHFWNISFFWKMTIDSVLKRFFFQQGQSAKQKIGFKACQSDITGAAGGTFFLADSFHMVNCIIVKRIDFFQPFNTRITPLIFQLKPFIFLTNLVIFKLTLFCIYSNLYKQSNLLSWFGDKNKDIKYDSNKNASVSS